MVSVCEIKEINLTEKSRGRAHFCQSLIQGSDTKLPILFLSLSLFLLPLVCQASPLMVTRLQPQQPYIIRTSSVMALDEEVVCPCTEQRNTILCLNRHKSYTHSKSQEESVWGAVTPHRNWCCQQIPGHIAPFHCVICLYPGIHPTESSLL